MSGDTVLDLGAAPGGWSQYAATRVGIRGRVFASYYIFAIIIYKLLY